MGCLIVWAAVLVTALAGSLWGQAAAATAARPAHEETVIARRLNDSVAVRFAADGRQRVLYFFDSRAELTAGDELEQGPSGQSTVVLAEGGQVEMYASGHLIVQALGTMRNGETFDVLRFPMVTTAEVTSLGRRILCILPGGTQAEFLDGSITVEVVPGRLRIRNEGGSPVELRGTMTQEVASARVDGQGRLILGRGDEVAMPYFQQRNRRLGEAGGAWAGLTLRDTGQVTLEHDARHLVATSQAPPDRLAAFTLGGVRVRVAAGLPLVFERQRRGAPTVLEVNGQPVTVAGPDAGAPAAAAETPPPGMAALDLELYTLARRKGHTVEQLAELGYWVPPSVLAEYERQNGQSGTAPDAAGDDGGAASDPHDSGGGASATDETAGEPSDSGGATPGGPGRPG